MKRNRILTQENSAKMNQKRNKEQIICKIVKFLAKAKLLGNIFLNEVLKKTSSF